MPIAFGGFINHQTVIRIMENNCKPYDAKVVRHGTSLHVVVPSHIRKVYEIDEGDELEVQLIRKGGATRICTELEALFA